MKSPSSSVKGEGTCPGHKAPQGPQELDYSSTEPNRHRNPNEMFLQPVVTSSDGNSLPAILSQAATMLCFPLALPILVSSHHRQPPWPPLGSWDREMHKHKAFSAVTTSYSGPTSSKQPPCSVCMSSRPPTSLPEKSCCSLTRRHSPWRGPQVGQPAPG